MEHQYRTCIQETVCACINQGVPNGTRVNGLPKPSCPGFRYGYISTKFGMLLVSGLGAENIRTLNPRTVKT